MTEIERKALALLNECGWGGAHLKRAWNPRYEALCRAVEQHEAFKREVSEAVERVLDESGEHIPIAFKPKLASFILPKPVDPLVEVCREIGLGSSKTAAEELRAALAKHGLKLERIEHE